MLAKRGDTGTVCDLLHCAGTQCRWANHAVLQIVPAHGFSAGDRYGSPGVWTPTVFACQAGRDIFAKYARRVLREVCLRRSNTLRNAETLAPVLTSGARDDIPTHIKH